MDIFWPFLVSPDTQQKNRQSSGARNKWDRSVKDEVKENLNESRKMQKNIDQNKLNTKQKIPETSKKEKKKKRKDTKDDCLK